MKETEITVQVFDNFAKIDETLKNKGFKMVENYQLNDWYFSKIDNVLDMEYLDLINSSFLVREIIDATPQIQLCYKSKHLDDKGNVIYEEKEKTNLADLKSSLKVFTLAGLNNYCKVENNSYVYEKGKTSFVVQIIKDLGIFIEYEEDETMKNLTPQEKFEYMKNVLNKLGLKLGTDFSCKKVFMLLHKNN